jgi:hypothetical protein
MTKQLFAVGMDIEELHMGDWWEGCTYVSDTKKVEEEVYMLKNNDKTQN